MLWISVRKKSLSHWRKSYIATYRTIFLGQCPQNLRFFTIFMFLSKNPNLLLYFSKKPNLLLDGEKNLNIFLSLIRSIIIVAITELTLSWRGRYHIETSPLICFRKSMDWFLYDIRKSMDWFLYDIGLRRERVKNSCKTTGIHQSINALFINNL